MSIATLATVLVSANSELVSATSESASATSESASATSESASATSESASATSESASATSESASATSESASATDELVPVISVPVSDTNELVSATCTSLAKLRYNSGTLSKASQRECHKRDDVGRDVPYRSIDG
ncbi:uncharacterized protein [Procambarus clarkii]|uniref:uncharacterized protein n=1 Tax=Procambarus clarkii TaxID=6728 RepID=UPI003742FA1D